MRLRRRPGVKEKLLSYNDLVILNPEQFKGKWNTVFGNSHPIHVELGTGRGQFITTLAEKNPDVNFLAVEVREQVLLQAVRKADGKGLNNIRFLLFNLNGIDHLFSEKEVRRFYINFCDPWPKKRHGKRRLTHSSFLLKYKTFLTEDGEIHFKTDNEALFEFSLNEISACGYKLRNIIFDLHHSDFQGNVMTEYEEKFVLEGKRIYRCEAIKTETLDD
ncbi:tRNA (guanosine(46)-N7)-methyltransferase TrmB [Microaerobacter geothermalis]|uniref:tRNA (guanosine(46)-N7)-methyltransferase TrmB n=1 Tax=Microaerobacter geothermalis TaxID=674972 RepID=UPI001F419EB6|nr:tRNA (guanosine(46)-N7)-methyltransferase TrmB [Microaerobacter geothermalis]MCF6092795.1 tRNA (guanosine(46)-N7)-methyltransferase TrmB [Microaerobacter geothermalis]